MTTVGDFLIYLGLTLLVVALLLGPGFDAFRKFLQRMFRS